MHHLSITVGNTPLVKLGTLSSELGFNVYGKLELLNQGGSMKDRAASNMINQAVRNNKLEDGATVIESSSGNMGIGLALTCLRLGFQFVCITDSRTNLTNIRIIKSLNGKVEVIESKSPSDNLLSLRLERVKQLLEITPNSYWPNQYQNMDNARAYYGLMDEIVRDMDGNLDFLFYATGTCGTIRGCFDYIVEKDLSTDIIAVDAVGSLIFGEKPGKRLIPGHGASIRPGLYREGMAKSVVHVNDQDAIIGCHKLLKAEGILAGGSTGAIITALSRSEPSIPKGSNVVIIIGDRGERYLDSIYSDDWLRKNDFKVNYE